MGKGSLFFGNVPVRLFMVVSVLCLSLLLFSGCSQGQSGSAKEGKNENAAVQETEHTEAGENMQEDLDEDMVSEPVALESLDTVSIEEADGISHYNFHTTKDAPLPLNEWAKFDIGTQKGATVPAYIRFTAVTRDAGEIEEHMAQYFKANNVKGDYSASPKTSGSEDVLMKYEILIGKEPALKKGDQVSLLSVRFPLQLYSTRKSGNFGEDVAQEREDAVNDVSVLDAETVLKPGDTLEKAVLCSVPANDTAYGIRIPWQNANGATQSLYFKLEY